ncbi:2-succinyl-5-enolpyruvyl-6-hydroxy-3-cyclohexene-1-carboxylic-acid synthase [Paraburkholderia sediminicola]|uniref:2-succinyl-5-enolpyruvyl-6-hydroxy-3- cyclohexene-1-carboxylic-acid synthase n=1 Tax=Paraburkholderia sediminicola TaxID=458836 RepID=UPI0038BD7FA1
MTATVSEPHRVGTAPASLNEAWVRCVVDAVCRTGVTRVVLCSGGRSSLMCIVFDADPRIVGRMACAEERSGAFIALGMAKASVEPVAIVTTSGSAVGNVVPALMEADACNIPLIVVSCDRPQALRGAGFGQMADHIGACGPFVRSQIDLADPSDDPAALRAAHEAMTRTLAAWVGGPVHINVPLAGVFDSSEPSAVSRATCDMLERLCAPDGQGGGSAVTLCGGARSGAGNRGGDTGEADSARRMAARVLASTGRRPGLLRGLIVAGPDPEIAPEAIRKLAHATGFPVLADAASGVRSGIESDCNALVLSGFDVFAQASPLAQMAPDLVIRAGHAPVSPLALAYLGAHPARTIRIARSRPVRDYLHPTLDPRDVLVSPGDATLVALAEALTGGAAPTTGSRCVEPAWRAMWARLASDGRALRAARLASLPWGEAVAMHACIAADGFAFMHVGNSMPVRHADIFYDNRAVSQTVYTSRGVSGIDGTLSTFIGESMATGAAGLLIIGDQAFLHDLPALGTAQRITTPACVCVVNNRGGAIFDFLPVSSAPGCERAVRNPYDIDFGALAAGFGLRYRRAAERASLHDALQRGARHPGLSIVELDVPAHSALEQLRALAQPRVVPSR